MEKKAGKERMPISTAGTCSDNAKFRMKNEKYKPNSPRFFLKFMQRYLHRGFTLLELVVVLFIISLVAAVVLPSFAGFGEGKLKSEAGEIASILRYLNDSALSRKETYLLKLDIDKDLVSWTGPDGEKKKKFDDITGVTTESAGMVSRGELTFLFEPLGVRENLSIHMSRGDKNISVTLNHLSGRVKIIDKDEG